MAQKRSLATEGVRISHCCLVIALCHVPQLGHIRARQLIDHFGSAEAVHKASAKSLTSLGFNEKLACAILSSLQKEEWQKDIELAKHSNVHMITFKDPQYPKRLKEIHDFPLILYIQGTLLPQDNHSIAIVNSDKVHAPLPLHTNFAMLTCACSL